ncbi:hypothetical protein JB92DRAFT_2938865 [Gautieria morchelliformis]|nr:hypothetical protein JB92DRAFT_2938865 [Gautieria morchelliformis]
MSNTRREGDAAWAGPTLERAGGRATPPHGAHLPTGRLETCTGWHGDRPRRRRVEPAQLLHGMCTSKADSQACPTEVGRTASRKLRQEGTLRRMGARKPPKLVPMAKKSNAFDCYKQYEAWVETQHGTKLKRLKSIGTVRSLTVHDTQAMHLAANLPKFLH